MLPILNTTSVFGRIIPGLLVDKYGSLKLIVVYILASAIIGYIGIVIKSPGSLIVYSIIYSFLSSAVVSLPSAVVAILAPSMQLVGTWMGMSFFFAALGILIGNPIAGSIIYVEKNQFGGGFVFSGTLVVVAGVLFVLTKGWKTALKWREVRRSEEAGILKFDS